MYPFLITQVAVWSVLFLSGSQCVKISPVTYGIKRDFVLRPPLELSINSVLFLFQLTMTLYDQ